MQATNAQISHLGPILQNLLEVKDGQTQIMFMYALIDEMDDDELVLQYCATAAMADLLAVGMADWYAMVDPLRLEMAYRGLITI